MDIIYQRFIRGLSRHSARSSVVRRLPGPRHATPRAAATAAARAEVEVTSLCFQSLSYKDNCKNIVNIYIIMIDIVHYSTAIYI